MEKTATVSLRVDPTVKNGAERILDSLGVSMSAAIDMFLRQVILTGGLPFSVCLPKAPVALNADAMDDQEIWDNLMAGVRQANEGAVFDAREVFSRFEAAHI